MILAKLNLIIDFHQRESLLVKRHVSVKRSVEGLKRRASVFFEGGGGSKRKLQNFPAQLQLNPLIVYVICVEGDLM